MPHNVAPKSGRLPYEFAERSALFSPAVRLLLFGIRGSEFIVPSLSDAPGRCPAPGGVRRGVVASDLSTKNPRGNEMRILGAANTSFSPLRRSLAVLGRRLRLHRTVRRTQRPLALPAVIRNARDQLVDVQRERRCFCRLCCITPDSGYRKCVSPSRRAGIRRRSPTTAPSITSPSTAACCNPKYAGYCHQNNKVRNPIASKSWHT